MSINEVISYLKGIALGHRDIESFSIGEDALIHLPIANKYPMFFCEVPISIGYETDQRFKTYSFAIQVLMKGSIDNAEKDYSIISKAELVTDAIMARIQSDRIISITDLSALTIREYTDDNLVSVRTDLTIRVSRDYCSSTSISEVFTDCETC